MMEKSMLILAAIFGAAILAVSGEEAGWKCKGKHNMEAAKECAKQLTPDLNVDSPTEYHEGFEKLSEEVKTEFRRCLATSNGCLNANGAIVLEKCHQNVDTIEDAEVKEKLKKMMTDCIEGKDLVSDANQILKCNCDGFKKICSA